MKSYIKSLDFKKDTREKQIELSLEERQKELSCIFSVLEVLSIPNISYDDALRKIAKVIPEGFSIPNKTRVRISVNNKEMIQGGLGVSVDSIHESLYINNGDKVTLIVELFDESKKSSVSFLPEEKKLLKGLADVVCAVMNRIEMEHTISEAYIILEQKNIALKEILFQIETEKKENQLKLWSIIDAQLTDFLDKKINVMQFRDFMSKLKIDMLQPDSDLVFDTKDKLNLLSPREFQISKYIKSGMSNKEISDELGLSPATIEKHRHSIRRKLDLTNKNINLSVFLRTIQEL